MIQRFRAENYKALRDVTLDLTPVHALIGPNDSGKTSILEAITALCRSVDEDLSHAFTGAWDGAALVWGNDPSLAVTFTADADIGRGKVHYVLSSKFAIGRQVAAVAEMAEVTPPGGVVRFASSSRATSVGRIVTKDQGATQEQQDAARHVHFALAGAHYYRLDPRLLSLPVAPDSSRKFRMEPSGFGLALAVDDILGYDRERFGALEERFQKIFPDIRSIKLIPEMAFRGGFSERGIPILQQSDGKGLYFESAANGQLFSAAQVSDGVLLVLAYLTVLYLPKPPRVLLIEEPENGIHPGRLEDVLRILRDLVHEGHHTQVILTTHSPYVLDLLKPEEVTLCRRLPSGEVGLAKLSQSETVRKQLDIFGLGEIWTAEGDEKLAATTSTAHPHE